MTKYKQLRKMSLITTIIILAPLPLLGLIIYGYSLIPRGLIYYLLMPLLFIVLIGVYLLALLLLSILIYKLHSPLKQGVFSIHSKEMDSWLAAQVIMRVLELFKILQIPMIIFKGLFKKVFNTEMGDVLISSGFVEHPLVDIGDHTIIGSYSEILGHVIEGDKIYIKKVKIGNNCTIGAQTIIMPGVKVGDGTIIGACSLVPKNKKLEEKALYMGVPVKKIKNLKKSKKT